MCALASLAEMPHLVERLFITQRYNEEGLYRLKICKNGEWMEVTVDDYFPCSIEGGPLFSRSNGNELWVLLLEKAYAKIKAKGFGKIFETSADGVGTVSYTHLTLPTNREV